MAVHKNSLKFGFKSAVCDPRPIVSIISFLQFTSNERARSPAGIRNFEAEPMSVWLYLYHLIGIIDRMWLVRVL